VNTASELRAELAKVFAQLKDGEITPSEAAELANLAGKMIASAKAQLEYAALRKDIPVIAFLKDDADAP
jgi:5-formyltetrahydrofolate cyclo-ligase